MSRFSVDRFLFMMVSLVGCTCLRRDADTVAARLPLQRCAHRMAMRLVKRRMDDWVIALAALLTLGGLVKVASVRMDVVLLNEARARHFPDRIPPGT